MCSLHEALDSSVLKPAPTFTLHILIESRSKVSCEVTALTHWIRTEYSGFIFYVSHIFRYVKKIVPWTLEFKSEHTLLNSSSTFGYHSRMNCNNSNRLLLRKGSWGRCCDSVQPSFSAFCTVLEMLALQTHPALRRTLKVLVIAVRSEWRENTLRLILQCINTHHVSQRFQIPRLNQRRAVSVHT